MSTKKKGLRLPAPDGLTLRERLARLPPEKRAELEAAMADAYREVDTVIAHLAASAGPMLEMAARTAAAAVAAMGDTGAILREISTRAHARALFALVALRVAAGSADPDSEHVGGAVRGVLRDLATDGNEHAAEAVVLSGEELIGVPWSPKLDAALARGGQIRDRLARLVMARARELWAELDKRTGEALGPSWEPVKRRFMRAEQPGGEDREEDREEDRDVIGRLGELMVPAPWSAEGVEVLAWDAWLAEWLEAKGDPDQAKQVRDKAEARADAVRAKEEPPGELWGGWSAAPGVQPWGPAPVLGRLALLAWPELRAELEKERELDARLRRPVAVPLAVFDLLGAVGRATGLAVTTGGREALVRERRGQPAELLAGWKPPEVTVQDAEGLYRLARAGVGKLATVTGARLLYWLPGAVQRRAEEPGAPLVIFGGEHGNPYAELAAMIGAPSDKDGARDVRAALMALGATWLSLEAGGLKREGHLLMVDYTTGRGRGHVSRLELTPGWPFKLNPAELRGEAAEVSALAVLPPLLGNLPPMPGTLRRNEHAGGARLWLAVLAEMAKENREIAKGNGAHLPGSRLAALAVEVGVERPEPLVLGAGTLNLWTRESKHGPALLECVGPDRYHLGPSFTEERRVLEEGGRHREGQAERGEIAARKRRGKAMNAATKRERRPAEKRGGF